MNFPGSPSAREEGHYIYVVSDGSGETAANLVRALITQFSSVKDIFIRRYAQVKSTAKVDQIVANALQNRGSVLIAYTLVNSAIRDYLDIKIKEGGLHGYDLFTTLLVKLTDFLAARPEENPDKFHGVSEKYFKRMEAVEFTINHDDGKRLMGLEGADVVLVGVSRTGKTPLSIYLSLYGLKVVNIPLAKGVKPPPELEAISQRKIVGLTIDPTRLMEIRRRRMTGLQVNQSQYSDPAAILEEVEEVNAYFRKHRRWPVIDVTNRSIEETATLVRDKVFGKDRRIN